MLSLRKLSFTILIVLSAVQAWPQTTAKEKLAKAKQFFWGAKFDSAKVYLDDILRTPASGQDILFDAYLYKGFVASRENQATEIRNNFIQAIKIDPTRKIDEHFFPPDLVELFNTVRDQIVGCVFINTKPIEAKITLLGEKMNDSSTPSVFCNLTNQEYEAIIVRSGYQDEYVKFKLTAGKIDTVNITLTPNIAQHSSGNKWWLWALGGAAATSAAVVFTTVIDHNNQEDQGSGLPFPPKRPSVGQ